MAWHIATPHSYTYFSIKSRDNVYYLYGRRRSQTRYFNSLYSRWSRRLLSRSVYFLGQINGRDVLHHARHDVPLRLNVLFRDRDPLPHEHVHDRKFHGCISRWRS